MIVAILPQVLRAAVHREIPFQEIAAMFGAVFQVGATACPSGAAVIPVVVREGVALITGVVVVV